MYVLCYLYLYTYNIYYLSNNVWHLKSFPASTDIKYIKTLPEAQRTQDIESKNWIISKKNSPSCVASARRSSGRSSGRRCWSRTGRSTLTLTPSLTPTPTLIPTYMNKTTQSQFSPWKRTISPTISIIYLFLKDLSIVWWHCSSILWNVEHARKSACTEHDYSPIWI